MKWRIVAAVGLRTSTWPRRSERETADDQKIPHFFTLAVCTRLLFLVSSDGYRPAHQEYIHRISG